MAKFGGGVMDASVGSVADQDAGHEVTHVAQTSTKGARIGEDDNATVTPQFAPWAKH